MLKSTLSKAAEAGAAVMQRYFQGECTISNKEGINNLVTEADHASEKAIFEVIKSDYPDHYILSEEAGEIVMDSNYKWIIAPIDGTVNFAHGLPLCCVSVAVEQDGEMIMGVVYNPFIREFYFAQRGYGATLNDKLIRVSNETAVAKACLVTGFPYTYLDQPNGPLEVFSRLIRGGVPVRRLGSGALYLFLGGAGRVGGGSGEELAC